MDLTQLANLGEFIGGVAVLVTLVYLATQVSHAREQIRSSARQVRSATLRELYLAAAANPEIAAVIAKAATGWKPEFESEEQLFLAADFTPEEEIVWISYQRAWWTHFRDAVANRHQLTESQIQELNGAIVVLYSQSPAAAYFKSMSSVNSPTVKYAREILEANSAMAGEPEAAAGGGKKPGEGAAR